MAGKEHELAALWGEVKASISVPSFYDNFAMKQSHIINDERNEKLMAALNSLFENSNDRW